MTETPILQVEGLRTLFFTRQGLVRAVSDVSFEVARGEVLAIVGESGCGKSITALSLMRLVPTPPGRIDAGSVKLEGRDLLAISEEEMRQVRGNEIAMIFQEPMTSLNPVLTIGDQIAEAIRLHQDVTSTEAHARAVEMLTQVRIPEPAQRAKEYPHQLSGGMRQRAMIAMALACNPKVLIADEPTTALDVTVQAQILDLLRDLQAQSGMAIILITHDLGVVAEMADEVAVMYAGKVAERATGTAIFDDPQHPYTLGLLGSIPKLEEQHERLLAIEGAVPPPFALPKGCRFNPRCVFAVEECRQRPPTLREVAPGHMAACLRAPVERLVGEEVLA